MPTPNLPIRDVSLREMLEMIPDAKPDDAFRWYVVSKVDESGIPRAIECLRVTVGRAREELGVP